MGTATALSGTPQPNTESATNGESGAGYGLTLRDRVLKAIGSQVAESSMSIAFNMLDYFQHSGMRLASAAWDSVFRIPIRTSRPDESWSTIARQVGQINSRTTAAAQYEVLEDAVATIADWENLGLHNLSRALIGWDRHSVEVDADVYLQMPALATTELTIHVLEIPVASPFIGADIAVDIAC